MRSIAVILASLAVFVIQASNLISGEIQPKFLRKVNEAAPTDYLMAIVTIKAKSDIITLQGNLDAAKATREQRHQMIVEDLQRVATSSQKQIMSFFNKQSETQGLKSFESFWIANLVIIEATANFILELATRDDVDVIYEDAPVFLTDPMSSIPASASVNTASEGLKAIKADALWNLGITGQGVIVCNIDTGVDGTHPALSSRWRGNNGASAEESWFDPIDNSTFPFDSFGHGTSTMGVMTGLEESTADTVGVAFGAQWIAANAFVGRVATTSAILASFQWVVDPDGDPSTIDDVPHVVNNSWSGESSDCSQTYWSAIDAAEAAGIAVVFSAGNGGPTSMTVGAPSDRITSPTNSFSVGALLSDNQTVASYSSRGPSGCDGVTIKPEVVAQGSSVRTLRNGGGFTFVGGTSFSAPYVAGAIALLRQFDPSATVTEIKLAFLNSATDLGPPGEDNDYGMGLINLDAAKDLLPGIDKPYVTLAGFQIIADDNEDGNPDPGETVSIVLTLANAGRQVAKGVSANLITEDPVVTIINGSAFLGDINPNSTSNNSQFPFEIRIAEETPGNHLMNFTLSASLQSEAEVMNVVLVLRTPFIVTLLDHDIGNVVFSVSDAGRFGFDTLGQTKGRGFHFPRAGSNHLFEGALIAGNGPDMVSHSARSSPSGPVATDWQLRPGGEIRIFPSDSSLVSDQDGLSRYSDLGSPNPLNLDVTQKTYSFAQAPDDDYVIVELIFKNANTFEGDDADYNNFYAGLYMDWDVGSLGQARLNNADFDSENSLGYVFFLGDADNPLPYVGVSVLNVRGAASYRIIDNQDSSNNAYQFTREEMWGSLSRGFEITNGISADWSYIISSGPYVLPRGEEVTATFAVIGGDDLDDLRSNAIAARRKYLQIVRSRVPLLGDVTGDGVINVSDLIGTINIILKVSVPTSDLIFVTADLNGDGEVSVDDLIQLIGIILGEE